MEPNRTVSDVEELDALSVFSVVVTFWQPANEDTCTSPLLGPRTVCLFDRRPTLRLQFRCDEFLVSRWIVVADPRRRMEQARHARRYCRCGYALHCSRNGRMVEKEACHTSIGAPDPRSHALRVPRRRDSASGRSKLYFGTADGERCHQDGGGRS